MEVPTVWPSETLEAMNAAFVNAKEKHGHYETLMAVGAAAIRSLNERACGGVQTLNPRTGQWEAATPCPYYHRPLSWAWKRLTGWRDSHGRKAQLLTPISEWFQPDI